MTPDVEALRRRLLEVAPELHGREIIVVRAPGRVNLIGEHTDYNDGFVLPVAIDLEIAIAFAPTDDDRVAITLADGKTGRFRLDRPRRANGNWIDYPAGVAWSLRSLGIPLHGFRGVLASTLPPSAGLSSSAALELASAWALTAGEPPIGPVELARAAQRAENEYVGVRSGIMDQLASALGRPESALLIDCRSIEVTPVPLPEELAVVAIESGSSRRLGASEYNARRAQCEAVVDALQELDEPVRALRDATLPMLAWLEGRADPAGLRRAEHVLRENERVGAVVAALAAGDRVAIGRLFAESHASLRDLYEVSSPALDALVEIAASVPGVVAARMTGAGFGGCTVNLVERDAVDDLERAIAADYEPRTGLRATVHPVRAAPGAGRVERA